MSMFCDKVTKIMSEIHFKTYGIAPLTSYDNALYVSFNLL